LQLPCSVCPSRNLTLLLRTPLGPLGFFLTLGLRGMGFASLLFLVPESRPNFFSESAHSARPFSRIFGHHLFPLFFLDDDSFFFLNCACGILGALLVCLRPEDKNIRVFFSGPVSHPPSPFLCRARFFSFPGYATQPIPFLTVRVNSRNF